MFSLCTIFNAVHTGRDGNGRKVREERRLPVVTSKPGENFSEFDPFSLITFGKLVSSVVTLCPLFDIENLIKSPNKVTFKNYIL